MKEFQQIEFDPDQFRLELAAFRVLLDSKTDLEEAADIKPFFAANLHLAAFLGIYGWANANFDLLSFEYQLFGDFSCDLVVGDSVRKTYGFIEWEDATSGTLFRQQGRKSTPEWATRLERGASQIIDWFWKLDDMASTAEFTTRFGSRHIRYFGLLVAGRSTHLAHPREQQRWHWRAERVLVNSHPIHLITYDQLYDHLHARLPLLARSPDPGQQPS